MRGDLTPSMRALFKDCLRWGEIGPDAEHVAGCNGAAFQRVVQGLINRGLLNNDGSLSDVARQEWKATTTPTSGALQ